MNNTDEIKIRIIGKKQEIMKEFHRTGKKSKNVNLKMIFKLMQKK